MKRGLACVVLAGALMMMGRSATAHHSFAAQYDRNKPVTLIGVVTRIEWMNPHVYFYMNVREASGEAAHWAIEGGAPNTLYRAGWRKDSLKVGDTVTVEGYLARDGSKLANMRTATLADGRQVLGGQQDGGPPALKRSPGR
jgi:hypothetical protein